MRTWKLLITLTLALGLAYALTGCDGDSGNRLTGGDQVGVDNYDELDFNLEYGGLTATDEPGAFDDPFLMAMVAEEENEVSDDPLLLDPEVLAMEAMANEPELPDDPPRPRFTFLRITWGMLDGPVDSLGRFDETVDLIDWSGLLRVDRGIVVVRRIFRFERPYDHLVYPRLDRQTVAWFSHTGYHFDGLLIEIIERPQDLVSVVDTEPNMLHFITGPFTQSFTVEELPILDEIFPVSPEPNAIRFTGFRLSDIARCPKGFLSGIWLSTDESRGLFKGRWVGLFGHLHGHLRGGWGLNDEGERILVGKYIGLHGHFRGLVRGTWEPIPDMPGHGRFHARWHGGNAEVMGVLGGRYFHLPTRPGGFFDGRWATYCDEEATNSIR